MIRHYFILLTGFFCISPLYSQQEEKPEISGIPAVVEAPKEVSDLGSTVIEENLEYLALSGNDLAGLYRKYTGRRVIVASAASKAEFEFVQPASPKNPLTYAQAAELLRKAATIENFIFVPDVTDPNLDFLTLATAGIKPTGRGVAVFTESDTLPEGDAVISYVMNLSYIKPDEAVRTFTQIIGQFNAFGSIAAVSNAASVVITENTSLIRKLIDLKAQIDKPSSQVATRFITVKFADVTELATTLNELLGTQANASRTAGVQRAPQAQANPAISIPDGVTPGGNSSGEETPVQIIPDARTNRIFAMGRPVDLLFVEGLISEFDTQSDQRNFLRRKLKFLAVADFLPIAGDALTRAFSGTGTGATENGATQNTGNRQQNNNRNSSSGFSNSGGNQQGFGGNTGGAGNSAARSSALSDPQTNSVPESLLIGRTLLVADNITNHIVVQGPPSGVEIIEKLLDQIDVKADQVMISTVFGQLSLGDSLATGVDWINAYQSEGSDGIAGSSIGGGANNAFDPTGLTSPFTGGIAGAFPNQAGLSLYGKIGNSLASYVNLLSTNDKFTVLSRPSIFTANNQKGTISSGRRIAVPTNSFNNGGVGGQSTNIEYRDVVLKLEVIPLVNSEDEITLQIALVSDDVVGQSDVIQGIGQVPIIGTRELLTTVTVPNNQTIVLGGLITTNDTETTTGIPFLSDIPLLGRLFSSKTQGVDRDELMIFIQPSIVNNDNTLNLIQTDMDGRYDVSDPARGFTDQAVLPQLEVSDNKVSEPSKRRNLRPIHRR